MSYIITRLVVWKSTQSEKSTSSVACGGRLESKAMASVDSQQDFFEGTEKLLEAWFTSSDGHDRDLRSIDRYVFDLCFLIMLYKNYLCQKNLASPFSSLLV